MTLLPDDTGLASSNWVAVGEATRHECLDDNNANTSYVTCSAPGRSMIIEFADPPVAEGDIGSITSVQFISSARSAQRGSDSLVDIAFQVPSGHSETATYPNTGVATFTTVYGTVRTQTPAGANWTYANVEDLEMICTKNGSVNVWLGYLALKVQYTEAVSADNATFFGANF